MPLMLRIIRRGKRELPFTAVDPIKEVLTGQEAASFLRLSTKTLYERAAAGLIPGKKVGRPWRFLRSELEAHLASDNHSAGGS